VDLDGEAVPGGGRGGAAGQVLREAGVGESRTGGVRVLPGYPAHGEAVATVRGDVDLEHPGAQTEQVDRIGARGGDVGTGQELAQHYDPGVILPEAQFCRGADHAVGGVTVGGSGGDVEVLGQGGAGQGHDHLIAHGEVVGTADDPAGCGDRW